MEQRMVKFYSKDSNRLPLHAIPGHFATSHSHINFYVDVTSVKARVKEAKEAARILCGKIGNPHYVDTIVCMDGTEVIGAFLAEEFEAAHVASTNQHKTIYVISPEENNGQIIFRDNTKLALEGKHVVLLLATTTTGKTIRRSMECIQYYGGITEAVGSVFSTVDSVNNMKVRALFTTEDVPSYQAYAQSECPFCKKGMHLEAMVNGFGYSKL